DMTVEPEVIFATETLTYGVNLAIADVIITGTRYNTRNRRGELIEEDLSLSSYHNMAGRAGRLGKVFHLSNVYIALYEDQYPMDIVERYYSFIDPVRSRIFVKDDFPPENVEGSLAS